MYAVKCDFSSFQTVLCVNCIAGLEAIYCTRRLGQAVFCVQGDKAHRKVINVEALLKLTISFLSSWM